MNNNTYLVTDQHELAQFKDIVEALIDRFEVENNANLSDFYYMIDNLESVEDLNGKVNRDTK